MTNIIRKLQGINILICVRNSSVQCLCYQWCQIYSFTRYNNSTVIPRLMKIIRSGITFVSRNVMLSGVSHLAVSNVNNPAGLVSLPYVMWSAHFFVTHIQTENIRSWNCPTVHVCCFMLGCASTETFVSRIRKTAEKIFVSRKIRQPVHSLAEVSLYIC